MRHRAEPMGGHKHLVPHQKQYGLQPKVSEDVSDWYSDMIEGSDQQWEFKDLIQRYSLLNRLNLIEIK